MKKLLLIPLLISINIAQADSVIYKLINKNGEVVYSDRLSPNEKGAYSVLSPKSGVLKIHVEKELNKEEISIVEEKEKEKKQIIEQNDLQKKKDLAILNTYSNVAEIEKMRVFEKIQIDQSIKNGIELIANTKDKISQNQEIMKANPNNKKLLEDNNKLNNELETNKKTLDYNKDLLNKRMTKYDEDKARYEQIVKEMVNNKK